MHDNDFALAVTMRMRVFLGRTAVGGPARVAKAVNALTGLFLNGLFEAAEFSRSATQLDLST
jgi:hypothetical protein